MIDICEPFEDFEYNAAGNYRCLFVVFEFVFMIHLTVLYLKMPKLQSLASLYAHNFLLIAWPILPLRLIKAAFVLFFPFQASQSHFICLILRAETTLQYAFSLSHIQMLAIFSIYKTKHKFHNFFVTVQMTRLIRSSDSVAFIISVALVNFHFSNGIVCCLYTLAFFIAFLVYVILNPAALIFTSCSCLQRTKNGDTNNFSNWWYFLLELLIMIAHLYQLCCILTFLIPKLFPSFSADYRIMFFNVTGVQAVKFMVSIVLSAAPLLLLPPVRSQMYILRRKYRQDRVAPNAG